MVSNLPRAFVALLSLACAGAVHAGETEARAAVAALLPQAQIERVAPAAAGWYEVIAQGQIVYASADGRHVLAGDLWQVEDRANLTALRRDGLRHDALQQVGAAQRIAFPAPDAKHTVTVLTDFDCGYCQRLHQDIAQYHARGISIDYLLYPRGGLDSPSFRTAVSVWCAVDRKQAFTLAKAGTAPVPATCPNPIAGNYELVARIGGITGTPAVIDERGRLSGYLTPDQLLARLEATR
jgi:thiol:disulfide interchange protein DsbC